MLVLLFEYRYRVLLARFSQTLTERDLVELDARAQGVVAREGPVRAIVDFSGVTTTDAPTAAFVSWGGRRPVLEGRAFVVPTPELFGLARLYSAYQQSAGHTPPTLARDLAEAYRALGIEAPRFDPIPRATADEARSG